MRGRNALLRKISTMLLALVICVTFMPAGVFADDEAGVQEAEAAQELTAETPADGETAAAEADSAETAEAEASAECTHDSLRKIQETKANCSAAGTRAHYVCESCGKKFLDALCKEEVTDDSQLDIPVDPEAHMFGDWAVTTEATPEKKGVETRTCSLCGKAETREYDYVNPDMDPANLVSSLTINGIKVQFNKDKMVFKKPESDAALMPGRVWITGNKASMKVSWENPERLADISGIIVLRANGTAKTFKEVARVSFTAVKDGKTVRKIKTSYTDKDAKKKNTTYTYRVLSYTESGGVTYVSKFLKSDWAAGQTSVSKLKNVYSATINKKTAKLQSKENITLKLTVKSPKTKFRPSDVRWFSSNKVVATVTSKGKVRAKAPGTAVIRGRLASGREIKSTITVVGAFTPGKSKLEVDYATKTSIVLKWSKAKNATSYDVYKSNDGLHWDKPKNTRSLTYKFTDLKTKHRYTFYVIARNDHKGVDNNGNDKTYTALGNNSNVINQKAVVKRRPMTLTGFPTKVTLTLGSTYTKTIKVEPPLGRKAELQMKSGRKWVKKKTIALPKGSAKKSVDITFPNDWQNSTKSEWRLVVPPVTTTDGFTTDTLKITSKRAYQNPSSYVQIKDKISKHGYSHYTAPVLISGKSTRSDCVEALIKTANKYKGDKYVQSRSGAPGRGIDESGLVMQACYGAGVDLWPVSPSTRPYNCVPNIMKAKLKTIAYKPAGDDNNYQGVNRGDLIFFSDKKNGTAIHVAIYLGWGDIIHADPVKGKVNTSTIKKLEDKNGDYKYYVVGVRRIFN